ncbi:MAG TPA: signal peptidase I [Blastocatellia bacterium]|jgi:signal peptidase I
MSDELEVTTREDAGAPRVVEPQRRDAARDSSPERPTSDMQPPHGPAFKKSVAREYFESAVVTLIMALFGMTFIVQAVKVPTGSMKNTIWIQDHLLVNKYIYGQNEIPVLSALLPSRPIRRGCVIVFKFPEDPQTNYVKRVIGLPGETVEYDPSTNTVYINGKELPENKVYAEHVGGGHSALPLRPEQEDPAEGATWTVFYDSERGVAELDNDENIKYGRMGHPFTVPRKGDKVPEDISNNPQRRRVYDPDGDGLYDSDQYFCLGDNRDNSLDGRVWGTVPRASVVGRAMFVYWSIDPTPDPDNDSNFIVDFFKKSRWSRTGTFIK